MKILNWIKNNILFSFTIFLLAFIPLYPKIPLLDVAHTWVYIRLEDFVVVLALLAWITLLLTKKIILKTPLTIPILIFWLIGGLTTLHGVLVLFPTLSDVFPNVALLSFFRRIEYLSLFFIAFASIKDKKQLSLIAISLAAILLAISFYGFGQKFLRFPAFLTMNEEFAKGNPIQLSELGRVPSTFAGHYDLAAYLVLVIPILVSLAFAFKNKITKIFMFGTAALGFVLLFMTVSRVSFFVLLLALLLLLILQKKKLILAFLLILTLGLSIFFPSLFQRFRSTVTEVNVLVNAKTGNALGEIKVVPSEFFKDKQVKNMAYEEQLMKGATTSATVPYQLIPAVVPLVIEPNASNGETLPQGTSYVNLPLSPVIKKVDGYFSEKLVIKSGVESREYSAYYGDYLIKRARAYDLSFTTRFQGEWPRTFNAFMRNIFLGSGYGSVSLAVDNNYLRILGESGLLGFTAFISIFIFAGIYIFKVLPKVESVTIRSFTIGFLAGSFGLILNAFLIDVFEASKVAFSYWLLMGVTLGALSLYEKDRINLFDQFKKILVSPFAVVIYIFIIVATFFSPMIPNYFVGDDFTWFRWASEATGNIFSYFKSNGFFFRPGTKIYFSLMYPPFWLNQGAYHIASLLLHFGVSVLLFFILKKVWRNYLLSILSVILFIILSSHHEAIFWNSSVGFLFNAFFALLALLSFINYREKGRLVYLVLSVASIVFSLLFHELGVVVPLLLIAYDLIFNDKPQLAARKSLYWMLVLPLLPYFLLRLISQSHWLNGDYSYDLFKLPYNFIGNSVGYLLINLLGPQSFSIYEKAREFLRGQLLIAIPLSAILILFSVILYKRIMSWLQESDRKIFMFGVSFFLIALLPFLGLGNITSRYTYLSSVGFVIIFVFSIQKIYRYLIDITDRYVGTGIILIFVVAYLMIQLLALQKLQIDWATAGRHSQNFLISLERYSKDSWVREKMQFYFVGQPIKFGEAWIWPVGLEDAVWFTFKNPNIAVYTVSDINSAFDQAGAMKNSHVFRFDGQGNVDEVVRSRTGEINLLNPPR